MKEKTCSDLNCFPECKNTKYDDLRSDWRELEAQFKNLIRQVLKAVKS